MERDVDDLTKPSEIRHTTSNFLAPFANIELNRELNRLMEEKLTLIQENKQLKEERDFFFNLLMKRAANSPAEKKSLQIEIDQFFNFPSKNTQDIGTGEHSIYNQLQNFLIFNRNHNNISNLRHKSSQASIYDQSTILQISESNFLNLFIDEQKQANSIDLKQSTTISGNKIMHNQQNLQNTKLLVDKDMNTESNIENSIASCTTDKKSQPLNCADAITQTKVFSSKQKNHKSVNVQHTNARVQTSSAVMCEFSKDEFLELMQSFQIQSFTNAISLLTLAQSGDAIVSYFTKLCGNRIQNLESENVLLAEKLNAVERNRCEIVANVIRSLNNPKLSKSELKNALSKCF